MSQENRDSDTVSGLLVRVNNHIEHVIAEANVIETDKTLVLASLAGVVWVVLRAGIRNFHHGANCVCHRSRTNN